MATKLALALIAVIGVVLVAMVLTGNIWITMEPLPAGTTSAVVADPVWIAAWLFVLLSAVVIVAVTVVRVLVRLLRRRNRV